MQQLIADSENNIAGNIFKMRWGRAGGKYADAGLFADMEKSGFGRMQVHIQTYEVFETS
jgi:hypothetical protein